MTSSYEEIAEFVTLWATCPKCGELANTDDLDVIDGELRHLVPGCDYLGD